MTIRRGKIQDYHRMTFDFSKSGKFIVDMKNYFKEVLKDLPEYTNGTAMSPKAYLFKTRDNAFKLDEKQAVQRVAVQLIFAYKRGRPTIEKAVVLLCTRVKNPDQDEYKKFTRVIKFLRRIPFLQLTM